MNVQVMFDFYVSLDAIVVLAAGCWFHTISFLQRVSSAVGDPKSFFSTIKESCSVAGRRSIFSRGFFLTAAGIQITVTSLKSSPGKIQKYSFFQTVLFCLFCLLLFFLRFLTRLLSCTPAVHLLLKPLRSGVPIPASDDYPLCKKKIFQMSIRKAKSLFLRVFGPHVCQRLQGVWFLCHRHSGRTGYLTHY